MRGVGRTTSVLLIYALILAIAPSRRCLADPVTVRAVLAGVPTPLPKGIAQQVRVVDASTGELSAVVKGKAGKKVQLAFEPRPSVVLVNHTSRKKKLNRLGWTAMFEPGAVPGDVVRTRIRMQRVSDAASETAPARAFLGVAGGAALVRVGVPGSGFTVSGPGLSGRMATGIASLVIVNLVQGAPCYGAPGGVVVVEVDPVVQTARRTEFQLCGAGVVDPSTCVADNYVAPDHSVRGSVGSDGTTATVTLELVGPNGDVIASVTESGPASDVLETIDRASQRLATRMCGQLSIVEASCAQTSCLCCPTGPFCQGNRWDHVLEVSARGAVGSTARVNFNVQYTQLDCGAWSVGSCAPLPCCTREAGQPEQTTLRAIMPFPFPIVKPACICPSALPTPVSFLAQLVEGTNVSEQEQILDCPE